MRATEIFASTLLLSTAAGSVFGPAWEALDVVDRNLNLLVKRQSSSFDLSFTGVEGNTATTTPTPSSTPSNTAASTTASNSGSSATDSASGTSSNSATTGSGSGSGSATATATDGGSSSDSSNATTTSIQTFDPRLPAGGVTMLEPDAFTTTFYKIDDYITFKWNYTSLSVTPSAVDILASCSLNQQTYTLALNQSVSGATQAFTWDTGAYQSTATQQLLTETYTLIIHDANKAISATPSSGYLATFEQFTFGMYLPQAYTPMADWVCVTCNAGITAIERQTLVAIFGMATVTVLSFSWFTGVAGLW